MQPATAFTINLHSTRPVAPANQHSLGPPKACVLCLHTLASIHLYAAVMLIEMYLYIANTTPSLAD